jgi:hypothetical protein
MENKDVLFYENQKDVAKLWLGLYIISLIVAFVGLLAYFSDKESISILELLSISGFSLIIFLAYLYFRARYVKITEKELEGIILFKKRVYKLDTLERYERRKSNARGYHCFIMYFGETVSVVSVKEGEKFENLLKAVIERNNANTNENDMEN